MFCTNVSRGQELNYTPEILLGHRSLTYLHVVKYNVNDKFTVNNLVLFDAEYETEVNNIYFIRNMASYKFNKVFSVNTAIGIKNPGKFATMSVQYQYYKTDVSISFSAGPTYQNGFTLEQSLVVNYTPEISKNWKVYFNLLAIANLNLDEYQRGLQQLRMGLKNKTIMFGLGANFDQFNNASKKLMNMGLFIKYNS
ncbi:hypothetical protein LX77_03249 [Gelidibacter algens]|uniref:Uncharacterized protein n=1 Tax=Gelidibacter algens TaxID=49280 RepID=A0A327RU74_9FLAO|nr:hypothetical protein [Gelidibacter algens]RAJ20035.1 hypothetical protein LX77_03249 [Gelidibacter algens]